MMAEQIPLSLEWPEDYSAESYMRGPANQAAFDWVMRWPDWPQNTLAISGGPGAGKTHLACLAAARSGAVMAQARQLDQLDWRQHQHFIVEDGPPSPSGETALFHIINWVRECGGSLLLAGQHPPAHWNTQLKDCQSRLSAIVHVPIAQPDDDLLGQLLARHFAQAGASVPDTVTQYIIARVERSYAGVKACAAKVNRLSMVKKAPVTTALVRQAMEWASS